VRSIRPDRAMLAAIARETKECRSWVGGTRGRPQSPLSARFPTFFTEFAVSNIFISYRRSDGAGYAGRIFDRLQKEFGPGRVYRDVDSLEDGTRFPDAIAKQLAKCRIVLVVIGPT